MTEEEIAAAVKAADDLIDDRSDSLGLVIRWGALEMAVNLAVGAKEGGVLTVVAAAKIFEEYLIGEEKKP